MEISILSLPDVEESLGLNSIYNSLMKVPLFNGLDKDVIKHKAFVTKNLQDREDTFPESFLEQLNALAKMGTVFIDGFYKFAFTEPAHIVYESKKNFHVVGTYNETITLGGIQGEEPYRVKTEEELKNLVYGQLVFNHDHNFFHEEVKLEVVESPKINPDDSAFGYGLYQDIFSAKNLGMDYRKPCFTKDYNSPKSTNYKNKLIEILYKVKTGVKTPYNLIPNPEEIYKEYVENRLKKEIGNTEEMEIEDNYGSLDYNDLMERAANFTSNEDFEIKNDLTNRVRAILKILLGIDDNKILYEVVKVSSNAIKKLIAKKENYAKKQKFSNWKSDINISKTIYIVACIHFIQNRLGIKVRDAVEYFVNGILKIAKEDIDIMGFSDDTIKTFYRNAIGDIENLINIEALKFEEEKRKTSYFSPLDKYARLLGFMKSSKPLKDKEGDPIFDDPIYKSIVEGKIAPKSYHFNPYARAAIFHPAKKSYKLLYDANKTIEKIGWEFSDFAISKFYSFYTFGCPKGNYHIFENGKCKLCNITPDMISKKDKEYYNVYKKNFELSVQPPKVIVIERKGMPQYDSMKKVTEGDLKLKIDELSTKFKIPLNHFYHITKSECEPKMFDTMLLLSEELTFMNLHKMQFLLTKYTGKSFSVLNAKKNTYDLFIEMMFDLLSSIKKEDLVAIISRETKFHKVDLYEVLRKRGIVLVKENDDDVKQFNDDIEMADDSIQVDDIVKNKDTEAEKIDEVFKEIDFEGDQGF